MTPSRHFTLYSSTVGSDGEVRTESTKRYVFLCSTRPNHSHTIGCQASHYLHEAGTCTLIHRKVVINSICKHTSSCSHLQLSHPDTCPRWKVGKIMLINITQCDHTGERVTVDDEPLWFQIWLTPNIKQEMVQTLHRLCWEWRQGSWEQVENPCTHGRNMQTHLHWLEPLKK